MFLTFIAEKLLSHSHEVTGKVPGILKATLIFSKASKFTAFRVDETYLVLCVYIIPNVFPKDLILD